MVTLSANSVFINKFRMDHKPVINHIILYNDWHTLLSVYATHIIIYINTYNAYK